MSNASGATARCLMKAESEYGVSPGGNFNSMPLVSTSMGMDQSLISEPILGRGRDPFTPQRDIKEVGGDVAVPVDRHNIGLWLTGLLGAPVTTAVAADGTIVFSGNPAAGSSVTLNGVAWTFVASGAAGTQTNIQGDLAATLAQLVSDLNGSANASIDDATYSANATTLTITHDTAGPAGNAYTLAASVAVVSGATLTGGAYRHRYKSGEDVLPSRAIEIGHPNVPAYFLNTGVMINTMGLSFSASGMAQATFGLIGQDEQSFTSTQGGTPASLNSGNVDSFSQFNGGIYRNGVALAVVESASVNYSNNLDPIRVIRSDGLISGADPGACDLSGDITVRFNSLQFRNDAENDTELEFIFTYEINKHTRFVVTSHNSRLPIKKQAVEGPGGIRATYAWRGALDAAQGCMMTIDLYNDYDGTLYAA